MDEIDPDWLGPEMTAMVRDLRRQFPSAPTGVVETTVRYASAELVSTRPFSTQLSILIRRRAQARIQASCGLGFTLVENCHRSTVNQADTHESPRI